MKIVNNKKSNKKDNKLNFIHIYFGNGKGKTTAALGLALRALGDGKKVAIIQFDKGGNENFYSDKKIVYKLKKSGYNIDLYSTGNSRINKNKKFRFKNIKKDYEEALRGIEIAKELILKGKQNILILDEIISSVNTGLLKKSQVEEIIDIYNKNRRFELILTGLRIWKNLKEKADLITQMKKVKHYYDKGIIARKGIEF